MSYEHRLIGRAMWGAALIVIGLAVTKDSFLFKVVYLSIGIVYLVFTMVEYIRIKKGKSPAKTFFFKSTLWNYVIFGGLFVLYGSTVVGHYTMWAVFWVGLGVAVLGLGIIKQRKTGN